MPLEARTFNTALRISVVDMRSPTSTPNALASGMHDAASGAVILMHQRLKERQQGQPVDLILTGGGASKIEQHLPKALILDSQVKIVDNLVLFGLQNWVEHTCNY